MASPAKGESQILLAKSVIGLCGRVTVALFGSPRGLVIGEIPQAMAGSARLTNRLAHTDRPAHTRPRQQSRQLPEIRQDHPTPRATPTLPLDGPAPLATPHAPGDLRRVVVPVDIGKLRFAPSVVHESRRPLAMSPCGAMVIARTRARRCGRPPGCRVPRSPDGRGSRMPDSGPSGWKTVPPSGFPDLSKPRISPI